MRRLTLERLECRQVLAGNVTAAIVQGELRITGDGVGNWVEIRQVPGADGTGRTFVIDGQPFDGGYDANGDPVPGGSPTLINGQEEVRFNVLSDKVSLALGGGNDVVEIESNAETTFAGLKVNTGAGRDWVRLERVTMSGVDAPLAIFTGNNQATTRDTVRLENVNVTKQGLNITTGGGNDDVYATAVNVQGRFFLNLGDGSDLFNGDSLTMATASLNTSASSTGVVDNDAILLSNSRFVAIYAVMSAGGDRFRFVQNVSVADRAVLRGGEDTDSLLIGPDVEAYKLYHEGFEAVSIV